MAMPTLYIVAGANGSGKTTFALQFIKRHQLVFINADELAKLINPTDLDKAKIQAGRFFFKELEKCLHQKKSFLIESTLSGHYLVKILSKAKDFGYQIHILYLYLDDPAINVQRVAARVLAGGHAVPKPDILRRFYRSKQLFWHTYREKCDRWELFYNANENLQLVSVGTQSDYEVMDDLLMQSFLKGVQNGG
ncbi:MAG: zeta toxin family protein [Candidatus Margulisiibacteriota bacterium]